MAPTPRRWPPYASPALDASAATLAALSASTITPGQPWLAAAIALPVALASLACWRGILGGSIGHTLLQLRTVSHESGLPSFRFHKKRYAVTRGSPQDPFALRPQPISMPTPTTPQPIQQRSHLRLTVDDGTAHTITHAALIGRDPTVPPNPQYALIAIPDLTRTVSKAHGGVIAS